MLILVGLFIDAKIEINIEDDKKGGEELVEERQINNDIISSNTTKYKL